MSERKPVCKRFLSGNCNASNCNYYHPKKKYNKSNHERQAGTKKKATYSTQNNTNNSGNDGCSKKYNNKKCHKNKSDYTNSHNREAKYSPETAEHQSSYSESDTDETSDNPLSFYCKIQKYIDINKAQRALESDSDNEKLYEYYNYPCMERTINAELAQQKKNDVSTVLNPTVHVTDVNTDTKSVVTDVKLGTFGAKLLEARAEKPGFDKNKFQSWLYNDMPNVDSITVMNLYCILLKKTEVEVLDYIKKTEAIVPDIMALLGKGLTNQKWLKELYGRFLGDSYTGIKSFTMKSIKELLTFTIVQIYLKTCLQTNNCTNNIKDIEYIISLYVCIMRIIGKLGIVLEIDDIDTIETNYNANKYNMFVC